MSLKKLVVVVLCALLTLVLAGCAKEALESKPGLLTEEAAEKWVREKGVRVKGATSSSTAVLEDGTFRTYYMEEGKIVYSESEDGLDFDKPHLTGIREEEDSEWRMISNPAVLRLEDGSWLMIYELRKGEERSLFSAFSEDGTTFKKADLAIDSTKEDGNFASVPDLVLLDDGSIRMYYVSFGEHIASAISKDNGKTWRREKGFRLKNKTVDPDVIRRDGKWIMYYATLVGGGNRIRKAISDDGLKWKMVEGDLLVPESPQGAVLDPDVVLLADGSYRMYFGEVERGEAQFGGPEVINLRSAILRKEGS